MDSFDTIAAVSTPPGTGGISCIRISGDKAFEIASGIFSCGREVSDIGSHSVTFGKVINTENEVIDEALMLKMNISISPSSR